MRDCYSASSWFYSTNSRNSEEWTAAVLGIVVNIFLMRLHVNRSLSLVDMSLGVLTRSYILYIQVSHAMNTTEAFMAARCQA